MLSTMQVVGLVLGGVVAGAGVYVMRFARTRGDTDRRSEGEVDRRERGLAAALRGASVPTRAAIGVSLLALGYHLVAYAMPGGWLWLRVPPERLWVLGLGVVVLVGGSLLLDRGERGR